MRTPRRAWLAALALLVGCGGAGLDGADQCPEPRDRSKTGMAVGATAEVDITVYVTGCSDDDDAGTFCQALPHVDHTFCPGLLSVQGQWWMQVERPAPAAFSADFGPSHGDGVHGVKATITRVEDDLLTATVAGAEAGLRYRRLAPLLVEAADLRRRATP